MVQALKKQDMNAAAGGIEALIGLTRSEMNEVNKLILSRTGSDVHLILDVANHLISSGGKRLRPMLTLACAALVNAQGARARILAAAVEFMHAATLLHDDVVDKSDMRRGHKTARRLWGNEASVLVGDFLLGQAFKMMVETESLDALRVLSHAAAVIAEGEVMQLENTRKLNAGEARYFDVIGAKTAALFAAACEVGPCLAKSGKAQREALCDYGFNLGIAFQLIDDVLDYEGGIEMGKNAGDDLLEGKVTLPVLIAYAKADLEQKKFWEDCFSGEMESPDLTRAIRYLQETGALEMARQRAQIYADRASEALGGFPDGETKTVLLQTVHFCVERRF